ncbi:MAG: F(420)H(2) dehydrogenase subunit A [Methanomassiliicoccales archaeon PtaU1.Bin124]|nr:MAG: F(420)H(2) dehydrogenase subunit A [Methanomassiliicoccales archaeon PtaU1.Bin124]
MLVDDYYPVAIFALVAVLIPVVAFLANRFFRPTVHSTLRDTTYECGEEPIGQAQIQFHVQFYIYAIIFVVFDIMTVFLMIWALAFDSFAFDSTNLLNNMPLIIATVFTAIMLIGVYYAIKKEKILWI